MVKANSSRFRFRPYSERSRLVIDDVSSEVEMLEVVSLVPLNGGCFGLLVVVDLKDLLGNEDAAKGNINLERCTECAWWW